MTTSAPYSNGFWKYMVRNVLSTARYAPRACAASATAAMSATFMVGFVGVSKNTSFVLGLNAVASTSASAKST